MAEMFPSPLPTWVRQDPKRKAEVRVYDALETQLPNSFKVFYSFSWVARRTDGRAWDGESDFVVAHANGILLIEVKGGGIDRDARTGVWTSTDGRGERHVINPLQQVKNGKFALQSKLKETPAWDNRWVEICHAIAFPDTASRPTALAPDMPREIVIFNDDLTDMGQKIEAIYSYWVASNKVRPIGKDGVEILRNVLSPTVQLPRLTAAVLWEEDRQILELTKQQFLIMEAMRWVKRVKVAGGAGTGKTMLAIEKVKRLVDEGRRTLFLCFNRPLADFLRTQAGTSDRLTVSTFHQFCYQQAVDAGHGLADPNSTNLPQSYFEQEMPLALMEALDARPQARFDAVVVDEGQDFRSSWWTAIEMANVETTEGTLYVFYDDNQRLYRAAAAALPSGLVALVLEKNLRNTVPIFNLARPLYRGGPMETGGPAGRPVEWTEVPSARGAIENALQRTLHDLHVVKGIPLQDIAVLTGCDAAHSCLRSKRTLGEYQIGSLADTSKDVVVLETIRRFKGLERPVVVLVELETVTTDAELLYVGLTRARLHLVVIAQTATISLLRDSHSATPTQALLGGQSHSQRI